MNGFSFFYFFFVVEVFGNKCLGGENVKVYDFVG